MNPLLAPFLARVGSTPDQPVLVVDGTAIDAATLHARVRQLATRLHRAGARPGDRIGLWLDNGLDLVAGLLATQWIGAVGMALHPQTRAPKLASILARTAATVVASDRGLLRSPQGLALQALHPAARLLATDEAATLHDNDDAPDPVHGGDDDTLAMIAHTSGSSGEPKGVMLSRRNLAWACETIADTLGIDASTRIGCALPLSFNYGQSHLWMALSRGALLVLDRGFGFPAVLIERWSAFEVDVAPLVPSSLALLLANPRFEARTLPSLHQVTTAAASLPPALAQAWQARFPGKALVPMYGQTECTRISIATPDTPTGGVGRGLPGQRHWLEDEAGRPLAIPGHGELVVEGPHVMLGYWEDPVATAQAVRAGTMPHARVLRTGDRFACDAEGELRYLGRNDEIIKSGGEKVSPREVEDVLSALPGVAACAVRAEPHPVLGEVVHAWVVPAAGGTPDVRAWLREAARRLDPIALPKAVHLVDALPLSDRGKVLKRLLAVPAAATPSLPESTTSPPDR